MSGAVGTQQALNTAGAQPQKLMGQLASLITSGKIPVLPTGATTPQYIVDLLGQNLTIRSFGAKGDGKTDDTKAFQAAGASGLSVAVTPGTYIVSDASTLLSNTSLVGTNPSSCVVQNTSANKATFIIGGGASGVAVSGMTINRPNTVTATAGGDGIQQAKDCVACRIENVISASNYLGFNLGPGGYSVLRDVQAVSCISDGLRFTPSADSATFNWDVERAMFSHNGGSGLAAIAGTTTATSAVLGMLRDIQSNVNTGFGISVTGSSALPYPGVYIGRSNLYGDVAGGLNLDTYGADINVADCYIAASGADGITVTANNDRVTFSSVTSNGNMLTGLNTAASLTMVSGGAYANNTGAGINSSAGFLLVNGAALANDSSSTSQTYGVYTWSGDAVAVSGCMFRGNTTGTIGAATAVADAVSIGNLPAVPNTLAGVTNVGTLIVSADMTLDMNLTVDGTLDCLGGLIAASGTIGGATMPGGGIINAGSIAASGDVGAATVNVSGGVYLNGTAYTNP